VGFDVEDNSVSSSGTDMDFSKAIQIRDIQRVKKLLYEERKESGLNQTSQD
jgi:hypothetical protein